MLRNLAAPVRLWWLFALLGAAIYTLSLPFTPYPGRPLVKLLLCAALSVAALKQDGAPRGRWLLFAALVLSGLGDLLLAMPDLKDSFLYGLAAFLLAHLAYIALFAAFRGSVIMWRLVLLVLPWLGAITMFVQFWPRLHGMLLPVAAYLVVLCSMASFAIAARLPGYGAAMGGLLFVASDFMVGYETFVAPFPGARYAVWITYAAAQLLLVAGLLGRHATPSAIPSTRRFSG